MVGPASLLAGWSILFAVVRAYVPAAGTSKLTDGQSGLGLPEESQLQLQWQLWDRYWDYSLNVSYQLVGYESNGFSRAPLIHFSEVNVTEFTPPSSTPWIALVSCDYNATNMSLENDIFTLARDKGAVAALLYSLNHTACKINEQYADPEQFDQVFDIFSTPNSTAAQIIEYQFAQVGADQALTSWYDSKALNESGTVVNETIRGERKVPPGYLFATLRASNSTVSLDSGTNNGTSTNGDSSSSSGHGKSDTGLAMIILYAITGCVSLLFCVVIITGAIRAIRHPERYGPRGAGRHGAEPPQSRARGLTRAILDTFPIVKFGSSPPNEATTPYQKDVEDFQLQSTASTFPPKLQADPERRASSSASPSPSPVAENSLGAGTSPGSPQPRVKAPGDSTNADGSDVLPDAIGRETCPICIVDFEEGDDLRQLPCEGQHRFHQECVDPWLLELSSSCPICREDFLALETMLSGSADGHDAPPDDDDYDSDHEAPEPPTPSRRRQGLSSPQGNRFSKYIRQAIRRRREQRDAVDPTDPPMPVVPST